MSPAPITFTLDLEDHEGLHGPRYAAPTRRLLEALESDGVRGTVFVVGTLAETDPGLIRDIAERGHEIALHAWRHDPLTTLTPEEFRSETAQGKALLEDLAQRPVEGFRAPTFSLVPASRWAPEILGELGFSYSSSVLPARNPLFGDPECPTRMFRWPSGLPELPCPVVRVGNIGVPFLGGVYLRALPFALVRLARRFLTGDQILWLYCHPYDFDPDEEFWVRPEVGQLGSRLLWYGRHAMLDKVRRLLREGAAPPLAERVPMLVPDRTSAA
jgi:peptidoglycan-N-acetylglucosamine deacetylase